jgi:hypothetical protein
MEKKFTHFNEKQDPNIIGVDQELMAMADMARHASTIPWVITSGKRSFIDNEKAGGVPDSAHVTGNAIDVRCRDSYQAFQIIKGALSSGINRIVIGITLDEKEPSGFRYHNIHIDNSKTLPSPRLAVKIYKE